jgi:hypothetical protein
MFCTLDFQLFRPNDVHYVVPAEEQITERNRKAVPSADIEPIHSPLHSVQGKTG